jgi:hypothetical protein
MISGSAMGLYIVPHRSKQIQFTSEEDTVLKSKGANTSLPNNMLQKFHYGRRGLV